MSKHKVINSSKQKQRILLLAILAILALFLIIDRAQEKTVSTSEPNLIIGSEDLTANLKDDIIVQNGRCISKF